MANAAQAPSALVLDERYQVAVNDFYSAWLAKQPAPQHAKLKQLAAALEAADPIAAGALVRANQPLLQTHHQSSVFRAALVRSYAMGDTALVRSLTDYVKQANDPVAVAENYLALAKFYGARGQWPASAAALAKLDRKLLSIDDAHYATLLHGYTLQAQKQHRKALNHYQQLPQSSHYYPELKLNEGTAFLRQGWWTDAHEAFKAALSAAPKDSELSSRIRVALGFSQLHHEFYRDARSTLRGVSLESPYANKALLGIGVAAAYEGDYPGAENAFQRLIDAGTVDSDIDEAHLLLAQARFERGANAAAATAFEAGIKYYEARLQELDRAATALAQPRPGGTLATYETLAAQAERLLATSTAVPRYLRDNYRNLVNMQAISERERLPTQLASLVADYEVALRAALSASLGERRSVLQSYLSQAKLGVAKLYDAP